MKKNHLVYEIIYDLRLNFKFFNQDFMDIKKKIMHMDVLITRINKMDNKIIIFEIRSHLSNIIPPCYKKQTTKYSQVSVTL